MFDQEKLAAVIAAYKEYFPNHWKDEKYKWEAIQHFQKYWDISAYNFLDMFMEATDKTYNLLANMNNYPRGMIKSFAMANTEGVRSMFMDLFDESKNLAQRIEQFIISAEDLRIKYDDGTWKQHYQTANAISTYLWLKYPDKYYIYKYSEVRALAREIGSDFIPKKGGSVSNIENSYKLYDEIRKILAGDSELDEILQNVLNEDCYPDPRKITMTLDVGFFVSRFYNQQKEIDLNSLHSDAKFSKWYAPVIESLYKMGGSGRRPDVHQRIIKDYGITDDELKVVNSTGNAQVLNDIDWARNYLVYEGALDKGENGLWTLTELGEKLIITEELASKLTAKWIKIKTAEREHRYIPDIDLTPYYEYRTDSNQNAIALYTKEDFLSEVYMAEENYDTLVGLLKNKKNLILQGAPGVGKTFAAKRLAYSMMGEKDDSRIEFVQFHQSYSYEDFVMGYKPQAEGFKLTNGIFYQFCMNAAEHPNKDYFFIIDEINRGNMSKIFGELLMLIEKDYRGTAATLAYSGTAFFVPKNLYIIGMMNTADRSLAMLDYALRRRFAFFDIKPGFETQGFREYRMALDNEKFNKLISCIESLNREISVDESLGEGFCIGHSYFCNLQPDTIDDSWLYGVVEYELIPLLKEYWFDEPTKVKDWSENLRSTIK